MAFGWCIAALALAGFVQGVLGFGFGLVAMALLPLLISVKEASPLVVLFSLPLAMIVLGIHWRHFQWRDGWVLLLGSCAGIPLGVYSLTYFSAELLLRLLGGVLLLFSAYELVGRRLQRGHRAPPKWSEPFFGLVSGTTSGAFNAGGPPLVAYVYAQPWHQERKVALLQVLFSVGAVLRLFTMAGSELFTPSVLLLAAWSAIPVLVMLLLGGLFMRRITSERLHQIVFLFIGVLALKYLFWS